MSATDSGELWLTFFGPPKSSLQVHSKPVPPCIGQVDRSKLQVPFIVHTKSVFSEPADKNAFGVFASTEGLEDKTPALRTKCLRLGDLCQLIGRGGQSCQ